MYSIRNLGTTAHRVDTTAEVFALLGDLDCHGLKPTDLIVVRDDQHLEEIVRGNNHIGIRLHGEPLPTLLAMLDEVDPHMRDGSGVRKPWQMQRRHWNAFCAIGSLAFNLPPCFSTPAYGSRAQHTLPDGTELSGSLDEVLEKILVHRYGFGRSGPQYGNGVDLNMRHEVHVQYALAAGWPVPQEVINDYIAITHRFQYDTELLALLERPFLRGVFTAGALHAVLALYEHKSERRITADHVGDFVKAVAPLRGYSSRPVARHTTRPQAR